MNEVISFCKENNIKYEIHTTGLLVYMPDGNILRSNQPAKIFIEDIIEYINKCLKN